MKRVVFADTGIIALAATAGFCFSSPAIPAEASDPVLVDIALQLGFQDRLGHGRGQVAADFNGDGWTDFYIGNTSKAILGNDDSFIIWNLGPDEQGNFQFEKGPVLVKGQPVFGAAAGDYDADGDPDLFLATGGQEIVGLDYLFRNNGDGSFTEVSEQAGVRGPKDDNGDWIATASLSAAWIDYDRDGDIDLWVASKIVSTTVDRPDGRGWQDSLFRNEGDGTFTDVSVASGLHDSRSSKTASWGDFDNDGWIDVFVPIEKFKQQSEHDFRFFRNNRDGTFVEMPFDEAAEGIGDRSWASAPGDFNNDGLTDIFVFAAQRFADTDTHAVLINQGNWEFENQAAAAGFGLPPATMGCQIGDLNNDGYEDIVMANGGPDEGEADQLWINETGITGNVTFRDASALFAYPAPEDPNCVEPENFENRAHGYIAPSGMSHGDKHDPHAIRSDSIEGGATACVPVFPYRGHAITFTDFDKDGDLDLPMIKGGTEIIAPTLHSTEPNRFFRNDGGNASNWLSLELHGSVSNLEAIGARVEVIVQSDGGGTRSIHREMRAGRCFSASGPRQLHFGLGPDSVIEAVRIDWPSGIRTELTDVDINQRMRVDEQVLQVSRFNRPQASGWTVTGGVWSVQDGAFVQSETRGRHLAIGGHARANYSVVGKLTYLAGEKKLGLAGRASNDGLNYYTAILTGGVARLFRVQDGELTALPASMTIEPMAPGKSYIVGLSFQGAQIRMSVDGVSSAPVFDTAFATGKVALATDNASAAFDNIAIY